MHAMTVTNLQSAFAGESQAHMRYLIWADKAEKDRFPNVARLFRAVSWAEQIHATSHYMVLRNEMQVLAPACASQDQFRDFAERGDRFRSAVKSLAREGAAP